MKHFVIGGRVRVAKHISSVAPLSIDKGQVFEVQRILKNGKYIVIFFKGKRIIVKSSAFEVFKPKSYYFKAGDKVRVKAGSQLEETLSTKPYSDISKEMAAHIRNRLAGVYGFIVSISPDGWCDFQCFSKKEHFVAVVSMHVDFLEPASNREL